MVQVEYVVEWNVEMSKSEILQLLAQFTQRSYIPPDLFLGKSKLLWWWLWWLSDCCLCYFVLFRYDNQLLGQYNIKCDEGRLAFYEVTEIDLQGREDCVYNGKQMLVVKS